MLNEIVSSNGFWLTVGILVGVAVDAGVRTLLGWAGRPILTTPTNADSVVEVGSSARVHDGGSYRQVRDSRDPPGEYRGRDVAVKAFRIKVLNQGKAAAANVRGTIELPKGERRICWYEGQVPTITINQRDHSFLDVFAIILGPDGNETGEACMPTETGWVGLYPFRVDAPMTFGLRVTAENARPYHVQVVVESTQGRTTVSLA